MLFQIAIPASNERGPRYMEKALASIHQARPRHPVVLLYGVREGQIGLFVRSHEADRDAVIEPIIAGYPEASVTLVDEWPPEGSRDLWSTEVRLYLELFPILRHSQFEDMINHNYADPISGLLRAIRTDSELECRVEITITPASQETKEALPSVCHGEPTTVA